MNGINSKDVDALSAGNGAQGINNDYISKIVVIYLLSFTILLIVISFLAYSLKGIFEDELIRHLFYVGSAGGLGGIVYCMRGFYEHKIEGNFDPNYLSWYFFRPIISTITGIIVFFLFAAQLIDTNGYSNATPKNIMFSCSLAFLAGFGFTQFYGKIDDLANTLFQPSDKRKNSNITWNPSDNIIYGTTLSGDQLNAKSPAAGKFYYNPEDGYLPNAGTKKLHVEFIPYDIANYKTASKDVMINVLKADPEVTWNPGNISSKTALSNAQLNAEATNPKTREKIDGNFIYSKEDGSTVEIGTVFESGKHTLHVDFTPTDIANYNKFSKDLEINVTQNE